MIVHALRMEKILTAIGLAVVLTFGFYYTDQYMAVQFGQGAGFWVPASPWDMGVPFAPGWIWIYLLYFPVCFLPLLFEKILNEPALFRRTAAGFAIQFIVALSLFWLLPSRMIRPQIDPQGLNEQLLFLFYQIDPGFNIFPSLHVANVTYVACLTGRLGGSLATLVVWILCGLITASTVLVKQHYLLDLPAGFLLGAASYWLAFSQHLDFSKPAQRHPLSWSGLLFTWGLRGAAAAMGAYLLLWTARRIGWQAILSSIQLIGWPAILGLFLLYAVSQASFCFAWYWAMGSWRRTLSVKSIVIPFLAGDALNSSIPSLNTAGEPLKVAFLRGKIPMEEAVASVTVYKSTDFISLTIFLAIGLIVALLGFRLPSAWYWMAAIILGGMLAISAALLALQSRGIYGPLFGSFASLLRSERLIGFGERTKSVDRIIRRAFQERGGDFACSLFFNFLGWFGGVLEAYICLSLLGFPARWDHALLIETFALFISNITFFIPARLGIVEGSRALIFSALGLPAAAGMAYGIIRRVRELAWMALGFALLAAYGPSASHIGFGRRD